MNHTNDQAPKKSNFRRYILVTLSRADATKERAAIKRQEIVLRVEKALKCFSILVAREHHAEQGHHHFHVGILMEKGLHRFLAKRTFRKLFPEFDGAQLNVSFHRAWTSVCKYAMKEDKEPIVWGKQSTTQIKEAIKAQQSHRKLPERNQEIIQRMKNLERWEQAKNVPIAYNEEVASIRMQVKDFQSLPDTHRDWNVFGLGDVEKHLEKGDRATITTADKTQLNQNHWNSIRYKRTDDTRESLSLL